MDEEQQREREDRIARMFALITMKLEDAAGLLPSARAGGPTQNYATGPRSSIPSSRRWEHCSLAQRRFLSTVGDVFIQAFGSSKPFAARQLCAWSRPSVTILKSPTNRPFPARGQRVESCHTFRCPPTSVTGPEADCKFLSGNGQKLPNGA